MGERKGGAPHSVADGQSQTQKQVLEQPSPLLAPCIPPSFSASSLSSLHLTCG